jgi:hypothetical protein
LNPSSLAVAQRVWTSGNWNAYVPAGKDKEERLARLAEVPEEMREQVREHTRTVFKIRASAKRRGK